MPNKYTVAVEVTGKDTLTSKFAGIHKTLNNFGADIRSALSPSIAGFRIDLVGLGKELIDLGVESERASFRLNQFAGSSQKAKESTDAFIKGAEYQITSTEAMGYAMDLLRKGMFTSAEDMEKVAQMAANLGDQTNSTSSNIAQFTRMLNLGSTRGLNQFGMNAEKVEKRIRELVKTGMTQKEAFKTAVFEEGAKQLAILGDDSMLAGEKLDKFNTAVKEAKIGFGALWLEFLKSTEKIWTLGLGIEELTKRLRVLPETFQKTVAILIYGYTWWDTFVRTLGDVKFAAFEAKGAVADYLKVNQDLAPWLSDVSEKTTKFTYITNDEVKARLEANKAAKDSIEITVELAGAIGALSESLKDATQAQIASAAIKGLAAASEAGKVSAEEYAAAANEMRLATGMATPESIKLATALQTNNEALRAGTMALPEWTAATNALISSGKAATTALSAEADAVTELTIATGALGESLKDATSAQIATAAMEGLTAAYKKGKIGLPEYVEQTNSMRTAVGLATPKSIELAEAIQRENRLLEEGMLTLPEWRKAMDALIATGSDATAMMQGLTIATGQLSESLMNASAAQVASEAIRGLTEAYQAGVIGQEEYTQAADGLRLSFGLATPESIRLVTALQLNNKALADGVIGIEEWRRAAEGLISAAGEAYEAQERQKKQEEEAKRAAEEHKRALEQQRQATIDLTVSTGQLSESLKNATAAQIASAAIQGLTDAYKAGKISQAEYIKAANDLRVAAGLATPESIKMASAIELNNKQLADGVITMEQWRKAMDALIASRGEAWGKPQPIKVRGSLEGKQRGGQIRSSDLYMTGERGPEATFLPRGSFMLDAADTRRMIKGATQAGGKAYGDGAMAGRVTNNYYEFSQTVNTRATTSTVAMDFQALKALAR